MAGKPRIHRLGFVAAAAVCAIVACTTDYQKGLDDPAFGGPNALNGQVAPPFSSDHPEAGGGGGIVCEQQGKPLIEAGTCTASFKKDILGAMQTAACGSGSCHGGPQPPKIDPADPLSTWQTFQSFNLSNGKPYINPCSTDPTASTIACNVNPDVSKRCGTIMPSGAAGLPAATVALFETWLQCGSPNN